MKRIALFGVVFALLLNPCLALVNRSAEVAELLAEIESASQLQRVNAAKIISRSGLQDEGLYREIAEILQAGYTRELGKDHIDEMAWMCKALAASGDEQYRELLDEVAMNAPSPKLQGYASQSAELIEQYARRSEILNASDRWDDQLTAEENRLVNMLNSDDIALRRDAAKILVRNVNTDGKVFSAAAETLKMMAENIESNNLYIDTLAWLCKAVAASGNIDYLADLEALRESTSNAKLRSYAGKAINALK